MSASEAMEKRNQLEAAVSSLSALGVIDPKRAAETVGRLGTMTGGDLGAHRKRAETKETLLNQEPQAQMSRRVMAIDPVNVFLVPESLFREVEPREERARLADLPGHGGDPAAEGARPAGASS